MTCSHNRYLRNSLLVVAVLLSIAGCRMSDVIGVGDSSSTTVYVPVATPDYSQLPAPIQNQPYVMTFHDEFSSLTTISTGPTYDGSNWYNGVKSCCLANVTGQMYPSNAQGATLNPYSLAVDGGLNITLSNPSGSYWNSGVLTSIDSVGKGFAQQYGYFEMKAKLPSASGTWPAFWLLSTQPNQIGEIDVMETYGQFSAADFTINLHDYTNSSRITNTSKTVAVASDLSAGFHTYGLLWTPTLMSFYLDGIKVWTHTTPVVMMQPYYVLADLGIDGGYDLSSTPSTNVMQIPYIRVYQAIPQAVAPSVHSQVFSYTGGDQTFTVPSGVKQFQIKAWGAGGGGGDGSYTGGAGAFATATIQVTSPIYNIVVGGHGSGSGAGATYGGGGAGSGHGGSGGGRSSIQLANFDLVTAAGGGGSGYTESGAPGGDANGGTIGGSASGGGASQTAGGTGGNAGTWYLGGGVSDGGWHGGGGGGYYGGGGGSSNPGVGGGGGGGSSFVGGANVSAGSMTAASGATPGGASDSDYQYWVGLGGAGGNNPGGDGWVVISW